MSKVVNINPVEELDKLASKFKKAGQEKQMKYIQDLVKAIEKQYLKLPISLDGRPIKPGDIVYGGDGQAWVVVQIGAKNARYRIHARNKETGRYQPLKAKWCTFTKNYPREK